MVWGQMVGRRAVHSDDIRRERKRKEDGLSREEEMEGEGSNQVKKVDVEDRGGSGGGEKREEDANNITSNKSNTTHSR